MFILGSHNSWSYLPAAKWWMRPFEFTAKCQKHSIKRQYNEAGVRCFDLRIKFVNGNPAVAHGSMVYKNGWSKVLDDLVWLNLQQDAVVRVLHEVRSKKDYTPEAVEQFRQMCVFLKASFKNLKFWCGRNLYNWEVDYKFDYNPSCEEKYSSVCPPRYVDDWIPIVYARFCNRKIVKKGTDKDILLIDFVNIR